MLSKVVRIGILAMLVVSLGLAGVGAKAAHAYIPTTFGEIYNVPWNGSLDSSSWDKTGMYTMSFTTLATTFGQLQAEYESKLGYPVVLLARNCPVALNFVGAGVNLSAGMSLLPTCSYFKPDPSVQITQYSNYSVAIFRVSEKTQTVIRLTLFGYVNDDGKSCVLWSLDGSRNANVADKCGGDAELVCTVKLVGKELEYDCTGDYDWLGEQIIHDPDWLAWAEKFANKNGKK